MFEYLCLCVHSPFYPLNLCLSSSSVSIEGLIPLMRGLRGLLVVQTFNAHLFARFSFRTHLFGFPFSLAVGHQAPPPVLSANIFGHCTMYLSSIYVVFVQCSQRVNIYGAIAQDLDGTWGPLVQILHFLRKLCLPLFSTPLHLYTSLYSAMIFGDFKTLPDNMWHIAVGWYSSNCYNSYTAYN